MRWFQRVQQVQSTCLARVGGGSITRSHLPPDFSLGDTRRATRTLQLPERYARVTNLCNKKKETRHHRVSCWSAVGLLVNPNNPGLRACCQLGTAKLRRDSTQSSQALQQVLAQAQAQSVPQARPSWQPSWQQASWSQASSPPPPSWQAQPSSPAPPWGQRPSSPGRPSWQRPSSPAQPSWLALPSWQQPSWPGRPSSPERQPSLLRGSLLGRSGLLCSCHNDLLDQVTKGSALLRSQRRDPPPGGLLEGLHPQRLPQCGERGSEPGPGAGWCQSWQPGLAMLDLFHASAAPASLRGSVVGSCWGAEVMRPKFSPTPVHRRSGSR